MTIIHNILVNILEPPSKSESLTSTSWELCCEQVMIQQKELIIVIQEKYHKNFVSN